MRFLRRKLSRFLRENASKRKLVIINSHDKIEMFTREIKRFSDSFRPGDKFLFFKSRVPEPFRHLAGKTVISEDYLAGEDYKNIDNYVFKDMSKNWDKEFAKEENGIFTHRGIELARIAEYDFQVFLLVKVKALAVLARAIKRENYEAFFIIDSTGELAGFDKLLGKHYGLVGDFVRIGAKRPFVNTLRGKIASFVSDMLDYFAALLAGLGKKPLPPQGAKLIDARLFYELGEKNSNFLLAPFEEGLRLKLKCLLSSAGTGLSTGFFSVRKRPVPASVRTEAVTVRGLLDELASRFVFEGVNYWILVEDRVKVLISGDFARFRKNIDTFFGIKKAHNIKSVILRNDVKELEKTVVLAAKKSNIPTLVIQHGILAEPNGHDTIFADKVAVWGERSVRWYRNFGNDPARLILTGNPRFESLFSYGKNERGKEPQKKEYLVTLITACQEAIRYSSFETDDMNDILIENVTSAAEALGNIKIAIKLHPSADHRFFRKLVRNKRGSRVFVSDKTNLYDLLKASDAVITPDSTVGLEALIVGKPLIAVNLTKRPNLLPYAESQTAISACSAKEIARAIKRTLYDEEARKDMDFSRSAFIEDFVYMPDGDTAGRIKRLIEEI